MKRTVGPGYYVMPGMGEHAWEWILMVLNQRKQKILLSKGNIYNIGVLSCDSGLNIWKR